MSVTLTRARRLIALAQTGLHYTQSTFDRERYEELLDIATEILAEGGTGAIEDLRGLLDDRSGYATPKIDVRGAIFRGDTILLVREAQDGKWALPGGFADVGLTPSQAVEKEIREETGLIATARSLVAVYDRDKRGEIPPYLFHIYKFFFLCDEISGDLTPSHETTEVAFHPLGRLPDLSLGRTLPWHIEVMASHRGKPGALFD